jgi:hypothetical protein
MDYIYLPCKDQIKSKSQLFIDNGVKPIAHLDRFKGQYLNPDLHQPYSLPAVFFKFSVTWEDLTNNTQKGIGILEVHVELENYAESADGSPDIEKALLDYETIRVLNAVLHGFKTEQFTALKRRSTDEDENPTSTNITIVRYAFEVLDESMEKNRNWLREKLDDLELKKLPYDITPPAVTDDDDYHI